MKFLETSLKWVAAVFVVAGSVMAGVFMAGLAGFSEDAARIFPSEGIMMAFCLLCVVAGAAVGLKAARAILRK